MAKNESESGKVAILDGDHLQPVWYNWIFDDLNFQPIDDVLDFYSEAFLKGSLDFPDAYVVLHLGIDKLKSRKENDKKRKRSNFEMHLRLIEPQRNYFQELHLGGHSGVSFIEATSSADIAAFCHSLHKDIIVSSAKKPNFNIVETFIRSNAISKGIGQKKTQPGFRR
ncbi:hypothetical protein [Sinobacterium caligoides]|uniref:hypothetical protein n=1 Tax=Sinobacterium caligoides TaxID=933926 RepID=UPI0011CE70A4|nr:hypothetical protein [Sinobacterium caligoides]